jgi:hypothetical protein
MLGLLFLAYPLLLIANRFPAAGVEGMDFYFLLFSLFFPRIVLIVYAFFIPQNFPPNSVPQIADILLGIFVPRILILIYIYQNMGYDNLWFVAHLIVAILAYLGGGRTVHRRRFRAREA